MAKMTGSELYDYILEAFKRTDKETEVYEAITDVIRDMKERYFFEAFKEEDKTLSISSLGDYTIALPDDTGHLIGSVVVIDGTSSKPLDKVSKEEYDRLYPNPDASDVSMAKPSVFCIYGDTIYLGAVPDSTSYTYKINISTKSATPVTSSTTEVDFTEYHRHTVKRYVLANLFDDLGMKDVADSWRAKGDRGFTILVASEKNKTRAPRKQRINDL